MRIAMLLPVADRPASRAYALWTAAARDFAAALSARGTEITAVNVNDPWPGHPSYRHGIAGVDDSLRVARLFRHADDFDLVHDMIGFAALQYAPFVATPILSTVWMEMWQAADAIYHDLNQRVFYLAPGDRDRCTGLLYSATLRWILDGAKLQPAAEPGRSLLFAGDLRDATHALAAIDIGSRTGRPVILLGADPQSQAFRERVLPRIDGESVQWIEDPGGDPATAAVRGAAAMLHLGGCDGMQQLVLVDAVMGGTPVLAVGNDDHPCWLRDGVTGVVCRGTEEAVTAAARLDGWNREACRQALVVDHPFDAFVSRVLELYERLVQQQHREDRRPWGYYQVLSDQPDHKVKRLVVFPGKRLSLQRHRRRDEHWYLVEGEAAVVQDEEELRLLRGQSIEIPKGCWHRIRNPGVENLVLIEVQTGDYFGEDDIERKEDDYGRT